MNCRLLHKKFRSKKKDLPDGSVFSLSLEEPQAPSQDTLALQVSRAGPQALEVSAR